MEHLRMVKQVIFGDTRGATVKCKSIYLTDIIYLCLDNH